MDIIDMHCDTILKCWRNPDIKLRENEEHLSLVKMKKAGALAQIFAIYISKEDLGEDGPFAFYQKVYQTYCKELSDNRDLILPALCYQDIMDHKKDEKMSAILAVEDGVFTEGEIEHLDTAYSDGVRLVTLLWNYENQLGFPNHDEAEEHRKGLKDFGFQVVERMNELGMIVDVSHLSEGGFYDVASCCKGPFVASHSCARALCNHRRNLSDAQLKMIGQSGGIVGINFEETFLNDLGKPFCFEFAVAHCKHIADLAGIEAVGLGSDFDGILHTGEIKDYENYPLLLARLEKVFSTKEMELITCGNALRVIREVIG